MYVMPTTDTRHIDSLTDWPTNSTMKLYNLLLLIKYVGYMCRKQWVTIKVIYMTDYCFIRIILSLTSHKLRKTKLLEKICRSVKKYITD